jgi:hypothetical protein
MIYWMHDVSEFVLDLIWVSSGRQVQIPTPFGGAEYKFRHRLVVASTNSDTTKD